MLFVQFSTTFIFVSWTFQERIVRPSWNFVTLSNSSKLFRWNRTSNLQKKRCFHMKNEILPSNFEVQSRSDSSYQWHSSKVLSEMVKKPRVDTYFFKCKNAFRQIFISIGSEVRTVQNQNKSSNPIQNVWKCMEVEKYHPRMKYFWTAIYG